MKALLLLMTCLLGAGSFAQTQKLAPLPEKLPLYKVGSGGKYDLTVGKEPTEVTLGFIESSTNKLVFEVHMRSLNDNAGIQMWQQFHLGLEGGKVKVLKGIMKIPMIKEPQILPSEYLQGYDGAQMSSFLIGSKHDLNGKKVGTESVTTPGGTFSTTHYRHIENGQTIDYWLADAAKPLGLVKIESTGKNSSQNYKMEFKGPVNGVKAEINADQAVPLGDAAKTFLPLLAPGTGNL